MFTLYWVQTSPGCTPSATKEIGDVCTQGKIAFASARKPYPGADPGFFLGGGALVSCSTSTPINHIFFGGGGAEYQLY